ncbi:MAG: TIGR01777 family oxidoreductase [Candidatus Kapabacteria bacterium]|nr:TIGR01777 family oxidoreductase [Candidatus Kapabacteria bacterium]
MNKIILFGGTGFLGGYLSKILTDKGYSVSVVNRKDKNSLYYWDFESKERLLEILSEKQIVINLTGSPIIGKRWNKKVKQDLIDSRQKVNELIISSINNTINSKVELYISASGIGYYGDTKENEVNEDSIAGTDFVSEICQKWEEPLEKLSIRKVIFRIGVVLHSTGGAYPKMSAPFRYYIGAALGSGKQYFPWIHLKDLVEMFVFAIENKSLNGIYNATAPEQVTNYEFSKELAKYLSRPLLPNIPAFILKLILGESADVLLVGQKASSSKIIRAGFDFKYKTIADCLNNIDKL